MRIAYAVPRYLPHLGGMENHVHAVASRMRGMGHEVAIATQVGADERAPRVELTPDGIRTLRFPSSVRFGEQVVSLPLWLWLRRGADRADLVHVHNYHAATTLGILAAVRGVMVFTPHYLAPGEGIAQAALHATYAPVMRRALRAVRRIICVTPSEAEAFVARIGFPERCCVIANGIDAERIAKAEAIRVEGSLVVMAGRLEAYKRPDLLLATLAHLPRQYRVAFVGVGRLYERLQRGAAALGLADRVLMPGQVGPDQVYSWYRAADVVVSLSRRECFGMTIAEGLAAGAGVVASDIGPHRDVLRLARSGRGRLIPADAGPADIAAAIRDLGARGTVIPTPSLPTWDAVAARTEELYRLILSGEDGRCSRGCGTLPGA